MDERLSRLPRAVLGWYEENKRCLPWRQTRDPYRIWVSEIMLQQSRVEAVKGYYSRFPAMTTPCTSSGRAWATTAGCGI